MTSFDEFDAPQYCNFDESDTEPERFFKRNMHLYNNNTQNNGAEISSEIFLTPKASANSSPCDSTKHQDSLKLTNEELITHQETNDIQEVQSAEADSTSEIKLENEITNVTKSTQNIALTNGPSNSNNTARRSRKQQNTDTNKFNYRWRSHENLSRQAAPSYANSTNSNLASSSKFVSMAEAIQNYQKNTPQRFRSRSASKGNEPHNTKSYHLKQTIPQSPCLMTKKRTEIRPQTHHIMSQKEREEKELEEIKKFRYKAHPVNKKILQGPLKAIHLEKKPTTVPQPFQLSQSAPKKESNQHEPVTFHAKPAPTFGEDVKLPPKKVAPNTKPITPSFVRKMPKPSPTKQIFDKLSMEKKDFRTSRTIPQPFSFEKRDQLLMKKKQEFVKKFIEEEKKGREFHANPVPKVIASKIAAKSSNSIDNVSIMSVNSEKSQEAPPVETFKARVPIVLYKKPFEPVKRDTPLTEVMPFNLNTTSRAIKREEFVKNLEQHMELQKRLIEDELQKIKQKEEEEIKLLRKTTVHKAKPIRKYKEVPIKQEIKLTVPQSPQFLCAKRQNKENVIN